MSLRVEPYGPHALLVRFAHEVNDLAFARAQALLGFLEHHPFAGLVEATPGFTTLLLEFEPGTQPKPAACSGALQRALRDAPGVPPPLRRIDIPVVYDGQDLDRVARGSGMSRDSVIELHTSVSYRVHLLGFAPGFAYLAGLDRRLHTPRLETPRSHVPPGSVAIGGEHTGVYPVASAGGWNLIGHTNVRLLDPERATAGDPDAFLLQPGHEVRFIAVSSL